MGELPDVGHYVNRAYTKKNSTVLLEVLQLEINGKNRKESEMTALTKYFSRLFD